MGSKNLKRSLYMAAVTGLTGLANCAAPADDIGVSSQEVIAGELDTVNQAVVYITGSRCSGTLVEVSGTNGYVLAAAHCLDKPPVDIIIGDKLSTGLAYPVVEAVAHPEFSITSSSFFNNDVAMLRFTGATPDMATIKVLLPEEDSLMVGTTTEHSGYGAYESLVPCVDDELFWEHTGADGVDYYMCRSDHRRHGTNDIAQLNPLAARSSKNYQSQGPIVSGTCFGDSGGPKLIEVEGEKRVAAVTSSTDVDCTIISWSARVSPKVDDFILPFIAETAGEGGAGGGGEGGGDVGGGNVGGGDVGGGDVGGGDVGGGDGDGDDADCGCHIVSGTPRGGGVPFVAAFFVMLWAVRRKSTRSPEVNEAI